VTPQRLYIEYAKGFNESNDMDIKKVIKGLEGMVTIGYFDVSKKSDLLRISPDSVLKDLKKSPDIKLEKTSYDDLLKTVNQLVKDNSNTPFPMDLDALEEETEAEKSEKAKEETLKEEYQDDNCGKCGDEDLLPVYGQDGLLYYLSPKAKGKAKAREKKEKQADLMETAHGAESMATGSANAGLTRVTFRREAHRSGRQRVKARATIARTATTKTSAKEIEASPTAKDGTGT